jgi:hypothetical protein
VTVWGVDVDRVARLVSEAFHFGKQVGVEDWQALGGARFYGRRHEYLGATLLSEYLARGGEDNAHVVMPGEACSLSVDALLQLLTRLRMWSVRCAVARLDLAVDGVPFTPADAYRAVLAGEVVSWVKRGRDGTVSHSLARVERRPGRHDAVHRSAPVAAVHADLRPARADAGRAGDEGRIRERGGARAGRTARR